MIVDIEKMDCDERSPLLLSVERNGRYHHSSLETTNTDSHGEGGVCDDVHKNKKYSLVRRKNIIQKLAKRTMCTLNPRNKKRYNTKNRTAATGDSSSLKQSGDGTHPGDCEMCARRRQAGTFGVLPPTSLLRTRPRP